MHYKLFSLIMCVILCLSMTSFSFAEEVVENSNIEQEVTTTEIKQEETIKEDSEKVVEEEQQLEQEVTKKEQLKEETTKEKSQKEVKVEKEVKEEEPVKIEEEEQIETEKVKVQFQIMGPSGDFVNAGGSSSITIKAGESGSKKFTIKGGVPTRTVGNDTYTWTETWEDGHEGLTFTVDRKTTFEKYAKKGVKEVVVNVKAVYTKTSRVQVTVNFINNINETQNHSWTNGEGAEFEGYSNKSRKPSGYDNQYDFLYWECDFNNKKYTEEEPFNLSKDDINENTTINLLAVYNYQPAVRVVYHYEDGSTDVVGDEFTNIDIYESAPIKGLNWYYDAECNQIIDEGEKAELSDTILTTEKLNDVTIVDVYTKKDEEEITVGPTTPEGPVTPEKPTPEKPIYDEPTITEIVLPSLTSSNNPKVARSIEWLYDTNTDEPIEIQSYTVKSNILPLSNLDKSYWALLNLILALVTCFIAFILVISGYLNERKEDENIEIKNKWYKRIVSSCVGILSIVIFFITENMNNPWIWVDQWTWLMAILFIVNIIILIITRHKELEKTE